MNLTARLNLFVCFFLMACHAVSEAQNLLTLEAAVKTALQNNYDIQLVKNDVEIARTNNTKGNAGMLPRVNATLNDNLSNSNIIQKLSNGNEISRNWFWGNNATGGIQASWTVFDGYRMFITKKRLEQLELQSMLNVQNQVQNTVASVINAYYDVVRQKQLLRSTEELIKTIEERVKIANSKFQIGTASKMDLLQGNIDLNVQQAAVIRQLAAIEQSKTVLNQLLARPANTQFDVSPVIDLVAPPDENALRNEYLRKNLQLQALEKGIDIANLSVKEAATGKMPIFNLIGGYNASFNQSQAGFFVFNLNHGLGLGFNASLPLYDAGNTNRLKQLAQIDVKNRQLQLERQKSLLDQSFTRSFNDYRVALEQVKLEESNIKLIRENLDITMERFRLGQSANSLELKEAQRSLEESNTRLISARFNAKLAETELRRISGALLE